MQLHFRTAGEGEPVVLLHGLFGSGDNLGVVARNLSPKYQVFSVDLRNHGQSPHSDEMSFSAMAGDLSELMEQQRLDSAAILGHSLGGKVAMEFALTWTRRVSRLIIIDIAPKAYPPWHRPIVDALLRLQLRELKTREAIDRALEPEVPQKLVRQFLLKSVGRDASGAFYWRINLESLRRNLERLNEPVRHDGKFPGPTLFITGAISDYVYPADEPEIKALFPQVRFARLAGAGHWVHADAPGPFLEHVRGFLGNG